MEPASALVARSQHQACSTSPNPSSLPPLPAPALAHAPASADPHAVSLPGASPHDPTVCRHSARLSSAPVGLSTAGRIAARSDSCRRPIRRRWVGAARGGGESGLVGRGRTSETTEE